MSWTERRFQAIVEELRHVSGVEVSVAESADPADDATIDAARELAGGVLPVERVFADWEDMIWFDSDERFRSVKPVDLFAPEACVAFRQTPGGRAGDELWFHHLGEDVSPTGWTFPEYVDRLLAARGYWYWSTTLCADGGTSSDARFLELFPGTPTDPSDHLGAHATAPRRGRDGVSIRRRRCGTGPFGVIPAGPSAYCWRVR